MARVGFKKTYPMGSFDANAVSALFSLLRAAIIDAGFKINIDEPATLDFSRADTVTGMAHDDVPHWALTLTAESTQTTLTAHSIFGAHLHAEGVLSHDNRVAAGSSPPAPSPDFILWFAADGGAGWWWSHINVADANSPTGASFAFACAGVTSRRYPSDLHQGLSARYGLRTLNGDWYPVYARNENGAIVTGPWTASWSPFGMGWANSSTRHNGSALPKMAVPQFPARDGGITACIFGEYNEIMTLTDGYTNEERVLPGWMALVGNTNNQPYAVPAPEVFATP